MTEIPRLWVQILRNFTTTNQNDTLACSVVNQRIVLLFLKNLTQMIGSSGFFFFFGSCFFVVFLFKYFQTKCEVS